MEYCLIFVSITLAVANAWPMQQRMQNPQAMQGQTWPWMANDGQQRQMNSVFDTPKWNRPNGPDSEMNFSTEEFPYIKPYKNMLGPDQGRPPMDPMGPPPPMGHMTHGPHQGPMPMMPPMQKFPQTGHPEFAPPMTPFDFGNSKYPIEYSPSKHGNMPAISVQYNITYIFSPLGWKPMEINVENATFHTTPTNDQLELADQELPKSDQSMTSGFWYWPKKTGSDVDGKNAFAKPIDFPGGGLMGVPQMQP